MRRFSRLPRWLRLLLMTTVVSLCLTINAIALTEFLDVLKPRLATPTLPSPSSSPAAPTSLATPAPSIHPEATLDQAFKTVGKASGGPAVTLESAAPAQSEPKYGHFPYAEAQSEAMVLVAAYPEGGNFRDERLHPEAASALLKMVAAARVQGIWLVPASGFRTLAQQRTLFNDQIAAKGSPEAAAKVSAPPGYSEHHTGYAVDLVDGSLPQVQDISAAFASAPAYRWLVSHAARFGFELSFPEKNPQGIAFEPWHWRYVGSPEAKALFAQIQASGSGQRVSSGRAATGQPAATLGDSL